LMRCAQCQHDNPTGAKFCLECGTRFAVTCIKCGTDLPAGAKFCLECGQALGVQSTVESRFNSPASYIPKHLAEKILTSKSTLEGERKQVTVLFADMKGSMELLADRDPEEARKFLDPVIEHMMEAVHHYEGTVNKVMGDGIMALFGAPLAHEDHAVRACYAALRMQESVRRHAENVRRAEGVSIHIRIGLNSGAVVMRSIGNDLQMDYSAIGQTVHLASRMEQMATPGTTMLAADSLRLAEGYVQVKPIGPVNVKGMADPVEVYELAGAGAARTRLQAAATRGLTRFVGRDAEIETLCQALEHARAGHGQVVALVGEPGVGKSRLFYEFTHSHRAIDWLIVESGSVSYGKATPYLPLIDLLKAYFKIEDRDNQREIREKVTGKLLTLDEALKSTLPALLTLLDPSTGSGQAMPMDDAAWQGLDPAERRRRTLEAVKRILLRESQVQPLLVVFEDLHWIDSETQAFLDSLIESVPTARFLLLVNYRPEYQHGWGSKTYYSQIRIDPLPPESAMEVLGALLGEDRTLLPLKDLLTARTEGTPFFLEESVRTLVEMNALSGERGNYQIAKPIESIQVPASVQAVLAARIDRLALEAKQLLQCASVIGKDFLSALLQGVAELSEENLRRELGHLQAAEFIYETRLFPDLEYTFKHALTHEVAYGSLLQDRRRTLHGRIVEAIENLYADRLIEQVERLAHHSVRAELWEEAVEYLHQAGKKAASRSATQEAIAYFEHALDVITHLPEGKQTIEKAINIRVDLGPGLIATKGFQAPEVEENYSRARALCEQFGETPQLFPVLWGLAMARNLRGELRVGRELGDRLLVLAETANDPALLLEAHHAGWGNLSILGELTSAWFHLDQGFVIYDQQKHKHHAFLYGGHDPGVCCGYHAAEVLWLLGYPDHALRRSKDSLALARELSHPSTMSFALSWAAWFHQYRGERRAVQARVEEGMRLATDQGFSSRRVQAPFLQGWLLVEEGHEQAGITEMAKILAGDRARGVSGRWIAQHASLLADAYRKSGRTIEGLRVVTEEQSRVQISGAGFYQAEVHRIKGELLLTQDTPDEHQAEACFQDALKIACGQSAKSLELRAAMSMSRLWQRQGKKAEAQRLLAGIYGWFTEGFDTADLKQAKILLDELA
jgi:class 3 adenylate cyclase/predicted ATPase